MNDTPAESPPRHTPGPWRVIPAVCKHDHPESSADVAGPHSEFVADCGCGKDAVANAKLIAAAPALADALEGLLAERDDDRDPQGYVCPHCEKARAALRAAGRLATRSGAAEGHLEAVDSKALNPKTAAQGEEK